MINRVGNAGVFSFGTVVEVDGTIFAHGDVFQQRVTTNCVVDFWLGIFRQFDSLRVATAFEVKYAVVIPAVFVIANQAAFRIGGQRCFTGTGQAKEDCHITFFPDVCRAVHGSNAFQRQQVVHHGEHTFLHFAAVPGAANQLDTLSQVESHEVFRVQTLLFPLWVGALSAVHHDEIRFKINQLFVAWADEHVFDEMRLPGNFGNEAHGKTGIGVSAAECINDKQALAGKLLGN